MDDTHPLVDSVTYYHSRKFLKCGKKRKVKYVR